ncbi:MAG: DUF2804 domain-containing protein [Candidatus Nanopelagicales bacterium]
MAEITAPVSLCRPNGRLNPAAVGWTRRPLHTANLRGWGRSKRWEYWGLMTPRAFIGLTVSSLDYLGLMSIYVLDRRTGTESTHTALDPLARNVALAHRSGLGIARGRAGDLALRFASSAGGVHITASGPDVDLAASVGPGQDSLGVVVPWSDRLFQYTVKDVARPVTGVLRLAGEELPFDTSDGSFAVLDHGRGRWPYSMTWNWAAGFGRVTGRAVGVQLGGKWTDATGSTENAVFVGGRMHRIHEDLAWHYDRTDWTAPWRITGRRADVTFAPFHVRSERTNAVLVAAETHQCFGRFTGWVLDETDQRVALDGLLGWAEEARNRW